jgi:hypothetical protein
LQQEPEADDPYALDDTTPQTRGAVAAREEPMEDAPPVAPPPRPMLAAAPRPQPVYPSSLPPVRAAQAQGEGEPPVVAARKGDRLDRVGRGPLAGSGAPPAVGSTAVAKDASRLGEGSAQQMRQAYAALPPRPPAPVPNYGQAPPPRPLAQGSLPPGWSVGAQPVARAPAGRGAQPSGADGDPDE